MNATQADRSAVSSRNNASASRADKNRVRGWYSAEKPSGITASMSFVYSPRRFANFSVARITVSSLCTVFRDAPSPSRVSMNRSTSRASTRASFVSAPSTRTTCPAFTR
ncbi:MAG: hypothetical protein QM756_12665 [Polyangiaceae bacterium]